MPSARSAGARRVSCTLEEEIALLPDASAVYDLDIHDDGCWTARLKEEDSDNEAQLIGEELAASPRPSANERPSAQPRGRFYERWHWIEWLFAATIGYLLVMSLIKPEADDTALGLAIVAFIAYKIVATSSTSPSASAAHAEPARNDETRCNNCDEHLARS